MDKNMKKLGNTLSDISSDKLDLALTYLDVVKLAVMGLRRWITDEDAEEIDSLLWVLRQATLLVKEADDQLEKLSHELQYTKESG